MAKTTLSYTFGYQWSQEKEVEPESNIQRLAMEPKDPLDHDADAESDLSVEDMKKVTHRINLRVPIVLRFCWMVTLIDAASLGSASIAG